MITPSLSRPALLSTILWFAILLRVFGVVVNNESNDPHYRVIQIIAFEHRIPADNEEWEAFQPKLYHATAAVILRALPEIPVTMQVRVAEAVSCIAGVLTLLVLLAFLRGLPLSARAQQLTFALVALNPKMVAMSIQATNDAFVILFASIALAAGYRFFRTFGYRSFAAMTAGILLAGISKGSGLVAAIAVVCTFCAALVWPTAPRRRILGFAAVYLLAFALFVPPLGQYWSRYQAGNSPFTTNDPVAPAPHFIEETFVRRPGVTSFVDAFLTFHFVNMFEDPQITNEYDTYPRHRTSFWSLLYGSMHSIHYDFFPPSWQTRNSAVQWLLRTIWILALVPTALLIAGTLRGAWGATTGVVRRIAGEQRNAELLMALGALGYLGFLMLFAFRIRDYASMKPTYLYPAVLPFMVYCAREFDRIGNGARRLLSTVAYGSATLLCVAYVAEVMILLGQLLALRLHLV